MSRANKLRQIDAEIIACRRCPRLVAWREQVAREKRRAYRDEIYWGKPVPGLGDADARVLVLGLAPGAHGANRTGRMFTGDPSGDWLFRALHQAGFANQPTSTASDDGLVLSDCIIVSPLRCVPPGNKPKADELASCASFLEREFTLLDRVKVVVALGGIAWKTYHRVMADLGESLPRPRAKFGHLKTVEEGLPHVLIGSYHPSQLNTSTGRLTEAMLQEVFERARQVADRA
ncbi:MAG: uracil-DNA glycosylase [Myxococcota bacterium]